MIDIFANALCDELLCVCEEFVESDFQDAQSTRLGGGQVTCIWLYRVYYRGIRDAEDCLICLR